MTTNPRSTLAAVERGLTPDEIDRATHQTIEYRAPGTRETRRPARADRVHGQ